MNFQNKLALWGVLIATLVVTSYAHLPSLNDASLQMGRIGIGDASRGRAAVDSYKVRGVWNETDTYRGDYTIRRGDTVSHGTFNGKKLWWWAKFYAQGADFTPGEFAPQGGTSPWVLINSLSASLSATGSVNYSWRGWNGDMNGTGLGSMQAAVPTWRDGAEGAYSFTHDDIGAMPFDLSVQPGWDVAKLYPDIKQCWGVYVEKMSPEDWRLAREMVLEGHEMFNHSMEHTSAADQWQWFRPGQTVPSHDPAIPEAIRGLKVVGTWGDPGRAPVYPQPDDRQATFESPLVAIRARYYWTQNAPTSEQPGKIIEGIEVIEPIIHAKPGVDEITLPLTGQKQYVKYDVYDSSAEPTHTGSIAATGATWMELEQLDEYGGLGYWEPNTPAVLTEPPVWDGTKTWYGAGVGTIYSYGGGYWQALSDAPGTDPDPTNSKWKDLGNITIPYLDSAGSYTGRIWSSSTQYVGADKGAPAFVAKVFCVQKWTDPEYKLNIQDANDSINKHIYEPIITSADHFRKGKRSEYYGYPFDAYSEVTHDSLEQAGFVGARGGAKSGQPIPGDFFHPYRIDFDAFYITDPRYTEQANAETDGGIHIYPNNPHVLMGMNEMVDSIISQKGYMIREFHSVANIAAGAWATSDPSEQWPLNSAAKGVGGWWGGVPDYMLDAHYNYIQNKIDAHELAVYTVGEVTKYRMTANATTSAAITKSGDNYVLSATTNEDILEKYREEISIIVALDTPVDSFNAYYETPDANWGDTPRRRPVMMDGAGTKWSVSMQPYLGNLVLEPNAAWTGPGIVVDSTITPITSGSIQKGTAIGIAGMQAGKISLRLPAGSYTANIFNAQGRIIRTAAITSEGGVVATNLKTSTMSNGLYILQVKKAGVSVFQHKFLVK